MLNKKDIENIENDKKKFLEELDDFSKNDLKISNIIDKKELIEDNNNLKDSLLYNKINKNFFSKDELEKNRYDKNYEIMIHIILVIIGFIVLILSGFNNVMILLLELLLNLCLPYIYIPTKILLYQNNIRLNIKKIYYIFLNNIN
jgi:hypothetical protein